MERIVFDRLRISLLLVLLSSVVVVVVGQKKILGDIDQQKISQIYDDDTREENVYRRPPTYLIIASKIVRPSTIYQVSVSLLEAAIPMRIRAALSRDGVEVYGDHVNMNPMESKTILLPVRPENNPHSTYRLRVEGAGLNGGAIVFTNETLLEFSRQFLSISISTNKAIYNGGHEVKIRAVVLTTSLEPYTSIADLFVLDPDGYIIRKWNSKELNNGVLIGSFFLPSYPKVGFWKIRVDAQGQIEEKEIKVEKYYVPKFEVYVRMPTYVFTTDTVIEARVNGYYPYEKIAKGSVTLRWFAKKIDYSTPMYDDSSNYRREYSYYQNVTNTYRSNVYDTEDGLPKRFNTTNRYGYYDPYLNLTDYRSNLRNTNNINILQNWTYIRSDRRPYRQFYERDDEPFLLYMEEIERVMGSTNGVQVRAEAWIQEYFYDNIQRGFCETRIINQTLQLRFVGSSPFVFKPGMTFETQISVQYHDRVALSPSKLESSTLLIQTKAILENGETRMLPDIRVPKKWTSDWTSFQDIDRLRYYGQTYGDKAKLDLRENSINPAELFTDDPERNADLIMTKYAREKSYEEYRRTGVHRIRLDIPIQTTQIIMEARYRDSESSADTKITAYASYSPLNRFIQIRCSNRDIRVGEYVIFHVKSNFAIRFFDWIILSKNLIIKTGREYTNSIHPVVTTFSSVVSSEMAPGFHILIYTITNNDDNIVSDSIYLPVHAINRHRIELKLNQVKDHLMNTVEAACRGDSGAVFLSSTIRSALYGTQGKNLITKASILESLHSFEKKSRRRKPHRVLWTDREGTLPDQITYYPSMDYGIDTNRTFDLQDLIVFTDFLRIPRTKLTRQCQDYPCLLKGCFTESQKCDGISDCEDGSDEIECETDAEISLNIDRTSRYRFSRFNRYADYYDASDGDWGWFTVNIDEDKEQFYTLTIPLTTDEWYFNVVSISKERGIGLLDRPITFSSQRPIHFYCEGPQEIHSGESVSIRCMIMNRSPYDLETVVVLEGSTDYKFIHVEKHGYVVSYSPRTSFGDHHHLVWIRAEDEIEVHFPIAPQRNRGTIDVSVRISTQIMTDRSIVSIDIVPEGSIVHRHTSALLDLKSRANVLRFMNIIVDETPIIPYEVYRRYISGSPYAHITICGDVIGPTFPGNEPVTLERMFPTGHGRFGKGTEYHAFNLAANTLQLHYFRLTNQFQNQFRDLIKSVFEHMNVEYTAIMRRFSSQGWVRNWDESYPNVWLTAWTIRIFQHASFQDWEDYIYIDPSVIGSAVMWLLNYQNRDGSFYETEYYPYPLHYPMKDDRNVSLTAHVLLSLEATAPNLQGEQKKFSATARQRARTYLERHLKKIRDPYQIAITAYALAVSGSAEAEFIYEKLMEVRIESDGMLYWSRTPITTNRVRYEFNRPFLEAKDYQDDDALAVETTGYALLTLFQIEGGGVTIIQDQIVEWLNTMRLGDGGFISTVDTIVAMEALVTYSYNSRIKDITDITLDVDIPDSNITKTFRITGTDHISSMRRIDIPNVWGHVNLIAHGAGQAIAQLDVNWGVDYEPFKDHPATDCFNLTIREYFQGRNKSEIIIRSCFSWTLTKEAETSGMAMLIVDIPSGYVMEQPDANTIVRRKQIPEMRDADVTQPGKTIWYFDHIPAYTQCFDHLVRRYYPVANLTRTRQAVIVEPLRPERFYVRTFNATSLYILSICEVCGSYQCPYCPFYSAVDIISSNGILLILCLFFYKLVINNIII